MGPCLSTGGGGGSKTRRGYVSSPQASRHGRSNASAHFVHPPVKPAVPDFGLGPAFEVQRLLGEGGTGQTWLCRDRAADDLVAIKFVRRPIAKVVLPMLLHEIQIQARLGDGHINLISAREVLLSPTHLGLVLQYAAGGSLTQYVSDRWSSAHRRNGLYVDEDEARFFFQQFLEAVDYLHGHRVAHRDLKLDNIVLTDHSPPRIKLCDFGFAKDWDSTSNMQTIIGTPVYMAPELIGSKRSGTGYDAPTAELWACGVLLFVILTGCFPFDHVENPDPNSSQAQVEVFVEQSRGHWREGTRISAQIARISSSCADLLDKIFVLDEKQRITIAGIRKHPWYTQALTGRFRDAQVKLQGEQSHFEARHHAVCKQAPGRDEELEALLARAGGPPAADEAPLERIKLVKRVRKLSIIHEPGGASSSANRLSELFASVTPDEGSCSGGSAAMERAASAALSAAVGLVPDGSPQPAAAAAAAAAAATRDASPPVRTAAAAFAPAAAPLARGPSGAPSSSAAAAAAPATTVSPAVASASAAAPVALPLPPRPIAVTSGTSPGVADFSPPPPIRTSRSSRRSDGYTSIYALGGDDDEGAQRGSSSGHLAGGVPPSDVRTPRTTEAGVLKSYVSDDSS